jgi:perosamine synthetase
VHPLAATIANLQFKHLDEWIIQRKTNLDYLSEGLRGLGAIEPFSIAPDCSRGAYYGYRVSYHPELINNLPANRFIQALQAEGVDANPERYQLLHRQALYQGASHYEQATGYKWPYAPIREIQYQDSDFPVAVSVHPNLISLPTFTLPCRDLIDQYIMAFKKVIEGAGQLAS